MLDIHDPILSKLNYFIENKKIPNLLFHGPSGSGKKTLLNTFIDKIYENNNDKKKYILTANCGHGKGIKFIRDDLKFFARSNLNIKEGNVFKSIILLNADNLTIDAQSALRRCIELFSHSTRFFIVVENKDKLLRPIISRFCEFYIGNENIPKQNLYQYNFEKKFTMLKKMQDDKEALIKKEIGVKNLTFITLDKVVNKMYEKGISLIDVMNVIKKGSMNEKNKTECLFHFNKIKGEFRNEKILLTIVLNYLIRYNNKLENIVNY